MIDTFSILLSHGLVFIACWRLLSRPDLDREELSSPPPAQPPLTQDIAHQDA